MKTLQLIFVLPLLTSAYNIDLLNPIIYKAPSENNEENQSSGSLFGYSVLLYSEIKDSTKNSSADGNVNSWFLVGAPKANYTTRGSKIPEEPGVTYRCSLSGSCVPIKFANIEDELGFIDQVGLRTVIQKAHGWFGAAMSFHERTGALTICAPRTIVRIYNIFSTRYQNTMHGICYNGQVSSDSLQIEDKNLTNYDFASQFWYNPLNGFAVHYTSSQSNARSDIVRPVIGSPKHVLDGTVQVMGQQKATELPINDDLTQFGYALSSGHYFHEDQLMVAAGAPGWQYVGQVGIMDPRTDPVSIIMTIDGKEVGSFFGASLTTGDMNNDGLDDLIVGAPHWKNDNGRVHIFLGNKIGFFDADIMLEGTVDDALYGYAVTCGDLDGDRFDDLVVGAPWEESGVIYIYNGDPKLQEANIIQPSQRIVASSISSDLLGFGFSLAKPADMDGNGFLDLGVGAYKSGHAVILLSRPVLKTELTLSTVPTTLPRNSTSFQLQICVYNYRKNEPWMWGFHFDIDVDKDYKRVLEYGVHGNWTVPPRPKACDITSIRITKNIRNYVDVINIVATHRFMNSSHVDANGRFKCKLCAIEYKGAASKTAVAKLAFDIGCGKDQVCQAIIAAKLEFQGIRNFTWIIGSDDIRLTLLIKNEGEPAYLTTVTFDIPKGISLRSILPYCQEEADDREVLRVTCDVDNPLGTGVEKRINLDLDMNRMHNGSADGTELLFRVNINTRSVNRGNTTITVPLQLKSNLSVALSGKAYEDSYYSSYVEKPLNVTFQHTYQVSRFGATPISEARLTVRVPYKIGDLEYLMLLKKPRAVVPGHFYECSVSNLTLIKHMLNSEKPTPKKESVFDLDTFVNRSRIRRMLPQDTNSNLNMPMDTILHWQLPDLNKSKDDENIQQKFYAMSDAENVDITYFNCSTPNVKCGEIVCHIASLKTTQDVVKLQLHLVVDSEKLMGDSSEKKQIIYYATEASVEVLNPRMVSTVSGTGTIVPVRTSFHRAPKMKTISIWIILASILLGLLALCLIATVLWKIGFFKRNKKEELETLKSTDVVDLETISE